MLTLRELRQAREETTTMQQVAYQLNVSYEMYRGYETGVSEPSCTTLIALSKYYEVPVRLIILTILGNKKNKTE
jgi:transcriptional regulator with XRE-family HTH domain